MPVTGDVNDPQFGIGQVVMKAFVNLITKVVTAPFNLLGRLVGVESEDFDRIEFRPGSPDLTPPEQEKLVKLAEALALRPSLALTLRGAVAADEDRLALQEMRVAAVVEARSEALPADDDSMLVARRREVLEALTAERLTVDLAQMRDAFQRPEDPAEPEGRSVLDEPAYLAALERRLVEAENVTPEDLNELAEERALAIRESLAATGQVEAERFVLAEPATVKVDSGWVPMPLEVAPASR